MAEDAANAAETVTAAVKKALHAVAQRQGYKKPKFVIESNGALPDGFTSLVHRATIADDADPSKPVLATITKTSLNVWGDLTLEMFDVEGHVYETVLPALEKIAGLGVHDPLPWPRCYYSTVSETPHVLTLGDMGPEGFEMARERRMDEDHCRLALLALARFHGSGLALQALRPDTFKAVSKPRDNPWGSKDIQDGCMPFLKAVKATPDIVKDKYPEGSEVNVVLKRLFDVFENNNVALMCPEPGPGHTFIHSDNHVNNLMFRYDKSTGKVAEARLIDFQFLQYGNPGIDVLLILFVCTKKAMRDAHWDSLLKSYHDEVQAVLKASGCKDPDAVYSWQLFQKNLADAAPYATCMTPFYHNGIFAGPETKDMCRDFFADPDSKNKVFPLARTPELKDILEGLVDDVVRLGWLPTVAEIDRRLAAYQAIKAKGRA